MKYSQDEMRRAFLEIESEAKPKSALIAAAIGAVPAIAFYALLSINNYLLLVLLVIPPLIIALFARFVGKTYRLKHRLPIGAIAAVIHIFGCYILNLSPLIYLLAVVAFVIGVQFSCIKLEQIHYFAIDKIDDGLLDLND